MKKARSFSGFLNRDFRYGQGNETEPGTFLRGNGIQTHYFTGQEVVDLFTGFCAESTGYLFMADEGEGNGVCPF